MAQQLNYDTNENIAAPHGLQYVSWNATGNFDYNNIGNPRLAFDPDRCLPPRQGQIYPVLTPLFTQ